MFVYKPLTPSELVCASYDHINVPIVMYILPEAICCCLQTCKFVVSITLMNNVHVQTLNFNFIRANMWKL